MFSYLFQRGLYHQWSTPTALICPSLCDFKLRNSSMSEVFARINYWNFTSYGSSILKILSSKNNFLLYEVTSIFSFIKIISHGKSSIWLGCIKSSISKNNCIEITSLAWRVHHHIFKPCQSLCPVKHCPLVVRFSIIVIPYIWFSFPSTWKEGLASFASSL